MSAAGRIPGLSPAKQALLRKRVAAGATADTLGRIPPRNTSDPALASFSQQRMWLFQRMYPDAVPYHSQVALHFTGPLDELRLLRALDEIVTRHEILRTRLVERHGTLTQHVSTTGGAHVERMDLTDLAISDKDARVREVIDAHIRRPFRLDELPLVRWTLLRLEPARHVLLCMDHHAITDGWTRNVVFKEMMALYNERPINGHLPTLPRPRLQFADFSAWQQRWLGGTEGRAQVAYWRRQLMGSPAGLDLPYDRPHPTTPTFHGGHVMMRLEEVHLRPLRDVTAVAQTTMFMTVFAAFLVLLHRYAATDDIAVGSGIANRRRPDTDGLVGMLINTVVLRVDLSGDPTFLELADRVRRVTLEAYANQEAPFEKVVEAVAPARRPGVNPLHQVTFNFQNNPMPAPAFDGLETRLERPMFNGSAKFDLYVAGWPQTAERRGAWQRDDVDLLLSWEYNTDVFDVATIARMQSQFRTLLVDVGRHPDRRISDLRIDDEAERVLLDGWSGSSVPPRSSEPIHRLFAEHVAHAPDRIALVAGDESLTYGELNRRAERVTRALLERGVRPGAVVGVCLERSLDLIATLLGVLKAGAAYVPVDPGDLPARWDAVLAAAKPSLVVTTRELERCLPSAGVPALAVEDALANDRETPVETVDVDGDALAYVLFTSGSTGEPRAVAVPHRAVARLVSADFARLDAEQTWLHLSPLAFDASTLEIWGPLCNGGRLVLMPAGRYVLDDIAVAIRRHGVTSVWLTAGVFQLMAQDRIEAFDGLRQVLTGGDVVPLHAARRVCGRFPALQLINGYGPTENTTFTTCRTVRAVDLTRPRLPIGRPIAGTTVRILDAAGRPCPIGVAGELWTGGAGLAHGYLHDARATDDAFVVHPTFGRLYRTGDRCRFLPDGTVEFLDRIDRQVKIRGHRVELPEIEAALRSSPGVRDAVAVVVGESAADKTVAAVVVPNPGDRGADVEILRQAVRGLLPEHAQPSAYAVVDQLPLTVNGKVDHDALREVLRARPSAAPAHVPVVARTPMEAVVASVWGDVLGRQDLGLYDDFFSSGGHSLAALHVISLLKSRTGVSLQAVDFFRQATIAGIATCAEKRTLDPEYAVAGSNGFIVELQSEGRRPPVFILPGGWGETEDVLVFAGLLGHLDLDRPLYTVRSRVADPSLKIAAMLEDRARDVMAAIAAVSPDGPFVVVGECAASSLAMTLAASAEAQGRRLEAVVLLDPGPFSHLRSLQRRLADASSRLQPMAEIRTAVKRVAKATGAFGTLSALRQAVQPATLADAPRATSGLARLPRRVTAYYRMLGAWTPRPLESPLHIVLSSRFPDTAGARDSWAPLATGPMQVHQVPGDHHSYVREHAADTARVLEAILTNDGP